MYEDMLSNEEILEIANEMNQYTILPNIIASYENTNLSSEMRKDIFNNTLELLDIDKSYDYSAESITDIVKTMIATFKKILDTIWSKIMQLIKAIVNYFKKDTEVDDMIANLDEVYDKGEKGSLKIGLEDTIKPLTNIKLANFLVVKNVDKLYHQKYLYNKVGVIRKDILTSIVNYISYINSELKRKDVINLNYKCYKDYFMNYVGVLYDQDQELASILSKYKNRLDDEADGFKYLFGYSQLHSYVLKPLDPVSMLAQVGYDSTSIVVNSDFNKDMMHKHLHTLSANKDLAMKEEHDIITIHKLLKVTKERLYKQAKNMTSEHNINTIQKYIKELTTTIPMLTRSMVITNSYMYTDYKNNIKKIYHAIETTY